jgi:hypothetical protein
MKTPHSLLPDLPTLTSGLAQALNGCGATGRFEVLERTVPRFMSTFPNEIVTCRLPSGAKRRVFIKYQANRGHESYGHRGDVAYEAEVYQRLLRSLPGFRPRCLGVHKQVSANGTWLILEYVYGAVRVSDIAIRQAARQPKAMAEAARWLGRFHAAHESRIREPATSFLKRYDAKYYRGWARRTFEFARPLRQRFPWLAELQQCGEAWFAPLLKSPPTIIHGEFYSKTILLRNEKLFMLDWESAAIAAGEIDLAALTEGVHWPPHIVRRCKRAYVRARWPKGAPTDLSARLLAAKMYLHFRWLGERPDWTTRDKTLWRYDHLEAAAKAAGLLS